MSKEQLKELYRPVLRTSTPHGVWTGSGPYYYTMYGKLGLMVRVSRRRNGGPWTWRVKQYRNDPDLGLLVGSIVDHGQVKADAAVDAGAQRLVGLDAAKYLAEAALKRAVAKAVA